MSITLIILIVVGLGAMLVMHGVGRGALGQSHRADAKEQDRSEHHDDRESHRGHGCC
jgi:hypothetical protein